MIQVSKRILVLVMVISLAAAMIAGCGNSKSQSNVDEKSNNATNTQTDDQPKAEKLDPVTLKIFMPGDTPKGLEAVKQEAEKRMADTLNVKLDIIFTNWADVDQKARVAMTSGEAWDLMWDARGWPHFEEFAINGYYEPLDELIEKYGQNLLKVRPKEMIEANKINGKTYGVPFDSGWYKTFTFLIRKDIREKLGVPEIKSYEDLEKFMYLVKEKEPGLVPYIPHGREFIGLEIPMVLNSDKKLVKSPVAPGILYFKGNDGKVYNMFDEPEPVIWDSWLYARKLYLDGILSKDTMQLFVQDFVKGKGAVSVAYGDSVKISDQIAIEKAVPGAVIESWSPFGAIENLKLVSNFKSGNFMAIPVTSRNKERAMMFLDWMESSQENYDLFAYGIKDKDYEIVEDKYFKWKPDTQWYYFAWAWVQNPTQDRMEAGLSENEKAAIVLRADASNFEPDIALGWEFDRTPVKNEIAQYNAAAKEMLNPIMQGVVDPAVEFPKFKEKVYPIVKKIQEEMQKSLDEYLKNKKQ